MTAFAIFAVLKS